MLYCCIVECCIYKTFEAHKLASNPRFKYITYQFIRLLTLIYLKWNSANNHSVSYVLCVHDHIFLIYIWMNIHRHSKAATLTQTWMKKKNKYMEEK